MSRTFARGKYAAIAATLLLSLSLPATVAAQTQAPVLTPAWSCSSTNCTLTWVASDTGVALVPGTNVTFQMSSGVPGSAIAVTQTAPVMFQVTSGGLQYVPSAGAQWVTIPSTNPNETHVALVSGFWLGSPSASMPTQVMISPGRPNLTDALCVGDPVNTLPGAHYLMGCDGL
jgi:hypothetical protein